ncbi:MAG: hypothetical protein V1792_26745 [Pseudomonadota bacterium]
MANMKTEDIKTHPTFQGIFTINAELLGRIEHDMREGCYDFSQPIILATWNGQEEPVCIDGHTRLKAATNAGIEEVAVYSYEFETEEDAFEYAIRLQSNRRNLTDGDLLHCIERIHESRPRGGDRKSEAAESTPQSCGKKGGRSAGAKDTAGLLNICARKVEQALTVIKKASPEVKEAVLNNEISINRAYQETRKRLKQVEEEFSTEKPEARSTEEKMELVLEDEGRESSRVAPVLLSLDLFGELHQLGGLVEDHLASAVKRYLDSVRDQDQDEADEDDDGEYFDPDAYDNEEHDAEEQPLDEEEHDESEEDDDEEYFDPDTYEED